MRKWGIFQKRENRKEGLKPWLAESQAEGPENIKKCYKLRGS